MTGAALIVQPSARCATQPIFIIAIQTKNALTLAASGVFRRQALPAGALVHAQFVQTRLLGIATLNKNALAQAASGAIALVLLIVPIPVQFVQRTLHGTAPAKMPALMQEETGAALIARIAVQSVQPILRGIVIQNKPVILFQAIGAAITVLQASAHPAIQTSRGTALHKKNAAQMALTGAALIARRAVQSVQTSPHGIVIPKMNALALAPIGAAITARNTPALHALKTLRGIAATSNPARKAAETGARLTGKAQKAGAAITRAQDSRFMPFAATLHASLTWAKPSLTARQTA